MKKYLSFVFLLFLFLGLVCAQSLQWKSYTNTNINISNVELAGQHIWVAGEGGAVDFNKTNGQFAVSSQADGVYTGDYYLEAGLRVDKYGYKWLESATTQAGWIEVSDNFGGWKNLSVAGINYYDLQLNPQKDSVVWVLKSPNATKKYYKFTPSVFPLPSDSLVLPNYNQAVFAIDTANMKWVIQQDTLWKHDGTNWVFMLRKTGINTAKIIPTISTLSKF